MANTGREIKTEVINEMILFIYCTGGAGVEIYDLVKRNKSIESWRVKWN